MHLLGIHYLHIVSLIIQKISLIIIETKTVWKFFCKDLKEHAEKIIKCKKKEMIPLTHEKNGSYENQKFCYICKKNLLLIIKK